MFKNNVSTKEGGVLAALFRKVMIENNLTKAKDYLIQRYVDKTKSGSSSKNIERKTKSSLIKYITAEDMSWKTFLSLMFDFIGAVKLDITVKVTFPNGNSSVHTTTVRRNIVEDIKKEKEDVKENDTSNKTNK